MKNLLLLASAELLDYCLNKFSACQSNEFACLLRGLSFSEEEISLGQANNTQKQHTITFKYFGNGHYYFALKSHSFCTSMSEQIGVERVCYLLESPSLYGNLFLFSNQTSLPITFNSDEAAEFEQQVRKKQW